MLQEGFTFSALAMVLFVTATDYLLRHLCRHLLSKPMLLACLLFFIGLTGVVLYISDHLYAVLGEFTFAVQLSAFFSIFTCLHAWLYQPDSDKRPDIHPTYIDKY
ncbi:hypothetical protein [Marinobacterium marinum]|uniref:Uncharacterized protein n=1 Tax=Marinobacterium marinum TaxID=2756129 RepID=A0A7W2AD73_9GAMM|nr:hypothetical protein [Marinobacterium marinum]MBA4503277.1 hypothetical protein [Marinobacterium marinum]